jgi:hypothetical protein
MSSKNIVDTLIPLQIVQPDNTCATRVGLLFKYVHGEGSGGINGTLAFAINQGVSTVCGHKHSCGGVRYHNNGISTIFALDSGCGIDNNKYAFRYGKFCKDKPCVSCGIVIDGIKAYSIPMLK